MVAPGEDTGRVGVSDLMGVGEWDADDPTEPTDPTDAIEAICRGSVGISGDMGRRRWGG